MPISWLAPKIGTGEQSSRDKGWNLTVWNCNYLLMTLNCVFLSLKQEITAFMLWFVLGCFLEAAGMKLKCFEELIVAKINLFTVGQNRDLSLPAEEQEYSQASPTVGDMGLGHVCLASQCHLLGQVPLSLCLGRSWAAELSELPASPCSPFYSCSKSERCWIVLFFCLLSYPLYWMSGIMPACLPWLPKNPSCGKSCFDYAVTS